MWKIRRVETSKYELIDSNGSVVEEYDQREMTHPTDWIDDAIAHGAEIHHLTTGDWEFKDRT